MSLVYGLVPAGNNVIEWHAMRTNKTYYAGQVVKLSTLGSVYTAAAASTAAYGVLLSDTTTTATEKTTKVPISVFSPGAKFWGRTSASASERCDGTLCDIALNTTSRFRVNVAAASTKVFQVLSVNKLDSATAAGRRVLVSVPPTHSQYIGVGANG